MMSFRSIGTSIDAPGRTTATATRPRHLPYDPLHAERRQATEPEPTKRSTPWSRSPHEYVLLIILATLIGRIILASTIGLGVDESYQVSVSRPLSLSYFDHPPLAFWLPGLVTLLTGSMNRVLLRLPFIVLFAGTTWMMFRLTARLFGDRAGAIAALILNVTPVLSVSTGGWILPDGPLMFWMLASALCLERVLLPPRSASDVVRAPAAWWMAAGACAGLAMLSKYHGVFLLAGTGLFLLTNRDARQWLRRPEPYLAALVAALVVSPVLLWNAQHDWISFRFQGGRGGHSGLHIVPVLQNIGGQLGYLLPWIGIPLAWVLGRVLLEAARDAWQRVARASTTDVEAPNEERVHAARWWLACLAIGPIATFTLIALGGHRGLPHWQAPGWLFVIPLLAERVDARLAHGSARAVRRTRAWLVGSAVAFALVVLALATEITFGWANRLSPSLFAKGDPSLETLDWHDLPTAIAPMLRESRSDAGHVGARPFIAATNWIDAGKIAYAMNGRVDVVCLCSEPHHFAFVHDEKGYLTRDAVIVERAGARPPSSVPLSEYFRSVKPIGTTVVTRDGSPAITLDLYRGETLVADVPARMP
ncbi:MAG: dolichyl-phosphate-mannose-protein mannosyltransferase [Gemmatimonadetes bacterium]|nr:dolichyl-phosphate-mannose-protein mannosyltransferase [Gemmatimonadota bacterium]